MVNEPIKLSAALAWILSIISSIGTERRMFGKTNPEVSQIYDTLVTPQSWAFGIWAVIFIGEAIGLVMVSFMDESSRIDNILVPFCYACIFFSREYLILSGIALASISYFLMIASDAILAEPSVKLSLLAEIIFTYPIRIHFAWTTAAMLINWNMVLVSFRLRGLQVFPALWSTWTAAAIGSFRAIFLGDCIFPAVIAWAISGMSSKIRTDPPRDFAQDKRFLENLATTYDLLSSNMWLVSFIAFSIDLAFLLLDKGSFRAWAAQELSGATWYVFAVYLFGALHFSIIQNTALKTGLFRWK
jgi:hypothetical protein